MTPISNSLSFVGNDVDGNGVLWAGDKNFTVWKSVDNGGSFQPIYRIPGTLDPSSPYSGVVWMVFVDSRGYIFVSAGGTNSLYRSTNGGASFAQVLNTNGTRNESFYISMTEDNQGSLYTVTYTSGFAQPHVLKSINGGASWAKLSGFNVVHFHNIKFNPYNGYLYVVTGEPSPVTPYYDVAKIFRSKDYGATWSLLVDRNDTLGTVYLAMTFSGNIVYVGQDYPNRVCQIHRFVDDGRAGTIVPQIVYVPSNIGFMPFMSSVSLNNQLVFGNCAEIQSGTTQTLVSSDGLTWSILASLAVGPSDHRWNMLTQHPRSGTVYATLKGGYSYQIREVTPPTPVPTAEPEQPLPPVVSANPTSSPVTNPTLQSTTIPQTSKPTPTHNPKPAATPTATPTHTLQGSNQTQPTLSPTLPVQTTNTFSNNLYVTVIIASVVVAGGLLSVTAWKKHRKRG